ncbi:MAG: SRPBCC family protein [Actinobacteria bacterium]|nr:SRPBCC family protein [Actinomycetota bacterium]
MTRIHVLERQQRIERPLDEVFPFYADAGNLERITPPWLGFEVTTPRAVEMKVGALIEYRLGLHGVPVRWRTRIEAWDPPHRFVDAQLSGPYSLWHHTHTFRADGAGATILGDRVRYSIPFGPLGEVARALFVERDLERIFDYRRDAVAALLGGDDASADAVRGAPAALTP